MTPHLVADDRTFPPLPPTDMDDVACVLAADWDAFRGIDRMANHWDRPGWGRHDRTYYWMLTFPTAPSLIAEARVCQQHLAHHGLDPVPEDGLHITMKKIGAVPDIPRAGVDELAQLAAALVGGPFEIQAHPMAGSPGAVRFTVTPWSALVRLHATLDQAAHAAAIPVQGRPTGLFRPHLGIFYCPADRPAAPVIESVAALRQRRPIPVKVRSVDLVELRREHRSYQWDVVHSVPLLPVSGPPVG
ncbi:2'-5' RNA ligase family protein [Streptomyces chrestomyceticus]|uniref:2'-5' RNA ligase family protein n=1 Tax=Streptomyces chrestomyceticus TaxID=68185 RepID=UPI0033EC66D0